MNTNVLVKSLFMGSLIAFISSFYFQETTYLDSGKITNKIEWELAREKHGQFIKNGKNYYIDARREEEKKIRNGDEQYRPVLTKVWSDEYELYEQRSKVRLEELTKHVKYKNLPIFLIFIMMSSGIYYLIAKKHQK